MLSPRKQILGSACGKGLPECENKVRMGALIARDSVVSDPRLVGVRRLSLAPENSDCRSQSHNLQGALTPQRVLREGVFSLAELSNLLQCSGH